MDNINGTIYFASNDAIRKRYYREGQHVSIDPTGGKVVWLSDTFVQIDLDSTGRNYVHLTVDKEN